MFRLTQGVLQALADGGAGIGASGESTGEEETSGCLPEAVERVAIGSGQLTLTIRADAEGAETSTIQVPWTPLSPRRERVIIPCEAIDGGAALRPLRVEAHAKLINGLRLAHGWLNELMSAPDASTRGIAEREGRSLCSVRMLLSLAFVDPAITTAALERRLPRGFDMSRLTDLPPHWIVQRKKSRPARRRQLGLLHRRPGANWEAPKTQNKLAPTICSTAGRENTINRVLSGVASEPGASPIRRETPTTTGTRLSVIRADGISHSIAVLEVMLHHPEGTCCS
jgi:hypothetical protein